jgi:Nif-specific regulatory protein
MGRFDQVGPLCGAVLDTLLESTSADIGAVLLVGAGESSERVPTVAAFRAPDDATYDRVSDYLSQVVLTSGEAVLGNDVSEDNRLASRDSLGRMRARSVICAPMRHAGQINGLVHLYATNPDNPLDVDDLEFTLAVADQLGTAIGRWSDAWRSRTISDESKSRIRACVSNCKSSRNSWDAAPRSRPCGSTSVTSRRPTRPC